jgi:ferrous iron transport protein A
MCDVSRWTWKEGAVQYWKLKMISSFTLMATLALADLPSGASGVLDGFQLSPNVAEHLMNLGFIPGVEVTAAGAGPSGDPRVYRVDGTEVALRCDLARRILVRTNPDKAEG